MNAKRREWNLIKEKKGEPDQRGEPSATSSQGISGSGETLRRFGAERHNFFRVKAASLTRAASVKYREHMSS
jgi:hypothetical protein